MKISPKYTDENWRTLELSVDSPQSKWQEAVGILHDRIDGRFLKFVRQIEANEFAGFAVMALDCLLIETLQQFREGQEETPRGQSGCYFYSFLTETSFGKWFNKEKAKMFYDQIRCGILHQAEVKGSSLIKINTPCLVQVTDDGEGLIIDRNLFHQQLKQEFEKYIQELGDPSNSQLRQKFKKKMDYICRVSS